MICTIINTLLRMTYELEDTNLFEKNKSKKNIILCYLVGYDMNDSQSKGQSTNRLSSTGSTDFESVKLDNLSKDQVKKKIDIMFKDSTSISDDEIANYKNILEKTMVAEPETTAEIKEKLKTLAAALESKDSYFFENTLIQTDDEKTKLDLLKKNVSNELETLKLEINTTLMNFKSLLQFFVNKETSNLNVLSPSPVRLDTKQLKNILQPLHQLIQKFVPNNIRISTCTVDGLEPSYNKTFFYRGTIENFESANFDVLRPLFSIKQRIHLPGQIDESFKDKKKVHYLATGYLQLKLGSAADIEKNLAVPFPVIDEKTVGRLKGKNWEETSAASSMVNYNDVQKTLIETKEVPENNLKFILIPVIVSDGDNTIALINSVCLNKLVQKDIVQNQKDSKVPVLDQPDASFKTVEYVEVKVEGKGENESESEGEE